VFDRENGRPIVVKTSSFDLTMSDSFFSITSDYQRLSPENLMLLLKCLLIIKSLSALPESALKEAVKELEGISRFYMNRIPQSSLPIISAGSIKGNPITIQVRPPIILES
jgi:hypothetical protein